MRFDPRGAVPLASCALLIAATSLVGCRGGGVEESEGEVAARGDHRMVFDSEEFVIGRKIDSMDGPSAVRSVELEGARDGELLWLTGVSNRAIDATSGDEMSQEFLCHSNLSWGSDAQLHRTTPIFRGTDSADTRLMTLIQGQNEIELPAGFGVPVLAGERLDFFTMVINKNVDQLPLRLKVRTAVGYRRDAELDAPLVPLFKRRLYNAVEIDPDSALMASRRHGDHGGMEDDHEMAVAAPSAMQQATLEWDEQGRRYGMHWMVAPGRHEFRTPVDDQLELPFDTTVHYVTAHLHPYGESIALVDRSSGEAIFELRAHPYADRLGIARMDSFSSSEGVALSRRGRYELVTVYDNPTDEPVDAMGILYLYLRDRAFERLGRGAGT